jgi:hypothetical protein
LTAQLTAGLQNQLWTSWASMLRVYGAAHGMSSPYHAVVEVSADEITLRVSHRWVRFMAGAMVDSEGNESGFELMEDGSVRLGETVNEMDMAAEQVARRMMSNE